jgi:hypothetical protein
MAQFEKVIFIVLIIVTIALYVGMFMVTGKISSIACAMTAHVTLLLAIWMYAKTGIVENGAKTPVGIPVMLPTVIRRPSSASEYTGIPQGLTRRGEVTPPSTALTLTPEMSSSAGELPSVSSVSLPGSL